MSRVYLIYAGVWAALAGIMLAPGGAMNPFFSMALGFAEAALSLHFVIRAAIIGARGDE